MLIHFTQARQAKIWLNKRARRDNRICPNLHIIAEQTTKFNNTRINDGPVFDDFDLLVQEDVKVFLDRAIVSMGEVDQTLNAFEGTANNASTVAVDLSDA